MGNKVKSDKTIQEDQLTGGMRKSILLPGGFASFSSTVLEELPLDPVGLDSYCNRLLHLCLNP